jgi:hypothetical protein
MKRGLRVTLLWVTIIPSYAQKPLSHNCDASGEPVTTLQQNYVDEVNGLLRDVHARLRAISERVKSRDLAPNQAQQLKLEATRDMIARLETLSAVYDGKVAAVTNTRESCAQGVQDSDKATGLRIRNRLTVDARELAPTATQTAGQ